MITLEGFVLRDNRGEFYIRDGSYGWHWNIPESMSTPELLKEYTHVAIRIAPEHPSGIKKIVGIKIINS